MIIIGRRYIGSAIFITKKYLNHSMRQQQQLKSITTLKGDGRDKALAELNSRGWALQDTRDAIQKTYIFGDFAEVRRAALTKSY